jgi:hypothetical protein
VAPSPVNPEASINKITRLIAGAAILLILIVLGVLLVPPYAANWRLQSYVNDLVDDPETAKLPPEIVRTRVLNQAAGLGLPVRGDDVHVGVTEGAVKIDVLYIVHVDLAGYTVDLHFRPAAGS